MTRNPPLQPFCSGTFTYKGCRYTAVEAAFFFQKGRLTVTLLGGYKQHLHDGEPIWVFVDALPDIPAKRLHKHRARTQ